MQCACWIGIEKDENQLHFFFCTVDLHQNMKNNIKVKQSFHIQRKSNTVYAFYKLIELRFTIKITLCCMCFRRLINFCFFLTDAGFQRTYSATKRKGIY